MVGGYMDKLTDSKDTGLKRGFKRASSFKSVSLSVNSTTIPFIINS